MLEVGHCSKPTPLSAASFISAGSPEAAVPWPILKAPRSMASRMLARLPHSPAWTVKGRPRRRASSKRFRKPFMGKDASSPARSQAETPAPSISLAWRNMARLVSSGRWRMAQTMIPVMMPVSFSALFSPLSTASMAPLTLRPPRSWVEGAKRASR